MLVRDIMNVSPITADENDSVLDVARKMRDRDVGAIPVVGRQRRPVGVVTDRDIVVRCVAENRSATRCRVADVLSGPIVTVEADRTLEYASRLMAHHQVRRLPVVEDGRLIGMISLGDIATRHPEKPAIAEVLEGVSGPKTRAARTPNRVARSRASR